MSITYVDDFCGAGGSSQGLREAGLELIQAANHNPKAIETHATNFPDADHLEADLITINMRTRPRSDVYWASPECTWHSPAGGRKRKRQMLDMFDEYVPDAAGERSRLTMMQVLNFAEAKRPSIVLVENVVEVADWELFETWLAGMTALGYQHQILSVSAAHIMSAENAPAPQWRDRVYFVFYAAGIEFPDVSPRPWAFCPECVENVRAVQAWKRPDRRKIGKYRTQYTYQCPSDRHRATTVEPWVLPAIEAIDWTNLGERIGDRKKPLAAATMRRIRVGAYTVGNPQLGAAAGQTWDAASANHKHHGESQAYYRATSATDPMPAVTGTPGTAVVNDPFMIAVNHDGHRTFDPAQAPLPTRSTKLGDAIITPFLAEYYGTGAAAPVDAPLGTVSSRGHHGLVVPYIDVARSNNRARRIDEPLAPVTTGLNQAVITPFMVERRVYDGPDEGRVHAIADPMSTRTASDRGIHGLVVPGAFVPVLRNNASADAITDPLATMATARHHALAVPDGAFLSKHHGGLDYGPIAHMNKSVGEPMPTIVAAPNVSLVIPSRRGRVELPPIEEIEKLDIDDFMFRMLGWREHATAQRFPREYVFTGNSSENTLMAGNAVASNVAHYLGLLARVALGDTTLEALGMAA